MLQLQEIGLVEPGQSQSTFNVQGRDPGVDLTAGETPEFSVPARPLTRAAAIAIASREQPGGPDHGVILDSYRDYRGVEVIGAWRWLSNYKLGVVTEVDAHDVEV